MATLTKTNPARVVNGSQDVMGVQRRLVETSETFRAGQWCFQKNDGLIYECASDADSATGGIQYVALDDVPTAIGNSTTRKDFAVITEDDVFEMFELDGTVTEGNIGIQCGIDVTSNIVTYDLGDTSNTAVILVTPSWRVEEFKNTSADVNAKAHCKVLSSVIEAALV